MVNDHGFIEARKLAGHRPATFHFRSQRTAAPLKLELVAQNDRDTGVSRLVHVASLESSREELSSQPASSRDAVLLISGLVGSDDELLVSACRLSRYEKTVALERNKPIRLWLSYFGKIDPPESATYRGRNGAPKWPIHRLASRFLGGHEGYSDAHTADPLCNRHPINPNSAIAPQAIRPVN